MKRRSVCAVVPAAGRGSRLGLDCPKILAPLDDSLTIWDVLRELLLPFADRLHMVLSPWALPLVETVIAAGPGRERISTSVQIQPIGMGDAIFGARDFWRDYETLLVVWGDQVNLSPGTIEKVLSARSGEGELILPLARPETPYVQWDFEGAKLAGVRQTREGDVTDAFGESDIGVFAFATRELCSHWDRFAAGSERGAATGEINFLPFLVYLSRECGWAVRPVRIADDTEARGVNSPADLVFARERLFVRLAECGR